MRLLDVLENVNIYFVELFCSCGRKHYLAPVTQKFHMNKIRKSNDAGKWLMAIMTRYYSVLSIKALYDPVRGSEYC